MAHPSYPRMGNTLSMSHPGIFHDAPSITHSDFKIKVLSVVNPRLKSNFYVEKHGVVLIVGLSCQMGQRLFDRQGRQLPNCGAGSWRMRGESGL